MDHLDPCHGPPPLRILGARQNNLQGFDLEIPHDRLTAVTGVSGSGKSSLAFDTLFAEGQWRYLESLPSYARLLLEKTARPAVDGLENVRPAVALEQQNSVRSARSIVGTATELYDLFRVLYASFGELRCPRCREPARSWTPAAAAREALARFAGAQISVEVAAERLEGLPSAQWAEELLRRGFARVKVGGYTRRLDEPDLPPALPSGCLVVVDRVRGEPEKLDRLTRAVGEAFALARGWAELAGESGERLPVGVGRRCYPCGVDLPELRPVLFSFNHPLGACPTCTGFGALLVWDEAKVVPDPSLTLAGGAIDPWQKPANRWWQEELVRLAKRERIPLDVPWGELPPEVRRKVWEGTSRLEGVEDFFAYLESKRYKMHVRVFLARYRSPSPCPDCRGDRLRTEVLDVRIGGRSIAEVNALSLGELWEWVRSLSGALEAGRELLWRIEEKLHVLLRLGLHYLSMGRAMRTLSGGEAQRVALATQLSNRLAGTLYVLDEPTSGLHARDVGRLAELLEELADAGNTVVCVEHDLSLVRRASYVVELGPGGGK
ncbi:MAG: excinuclease ABC subunit A, partial [Deltaproteobacteria bacterium]|nr:excinuclease ABC subunit A [Deltaproteobacteria bacterium]